MEVVYLDCTRTWSTFWGVAFKTFDEKSLVGYEIFTIFGISIMLNPLPLPHKMDSNLGERNFALYFLRVC